ncbi:hypothetical protein AWR36_006820 [Microbulbifer flavimaris]|uniref:PepSY domain-containing protein n=1 Tax=Microbulbifer flavimaris TaxID=1781068 RepID=A0ABX4I0S2_9GAMM|nr:MULTISPECIES: hypothetical protein [Microbulbifer]KUJ83563.1 hypothetical protein AVO43_06810 [Microbulbifer sp. ZGT114]PCO05721.1 hypothetical protein AWR36_006820 [Microbulbifer flavimaris]
MKLASRLRKLHQWIFLAIGLQALLWVASGFYMVVVNLDFIHGDHLVRNLREPLPEFSRPLYPTAQLISRSDGVKSVKLKAIQGQPFYIMQNSQGEHLYDAFTGNKAPTIDAPRASQLARHFYAGEGMVTSTRLITENPPTEIPARILPVWRIDFDDRFGTSFYIDPDTGTLITRRHDYWRAFDFFWMLHIMDYDERADVTNPVLRLLILSSLVGVLSGAALLPYSFRLVRGKRARRGRVRRRAAA